MPESNSTQIVPADKPTKPHPDFPLFPHATKRWAKKIKGKMVYFGPWADPDQALQRYRDFLNGKSARKPKARPGVMTPAKGRLKKPNKPHKDFPLFAHATKRWAKKIRGRLAYFGSWADPAGALAKWNAEKDELLAGRVPRSRVSGAGVTLGDVANKFLAGHKGRVETGELSPRTFTCNYHTCANLVKHFGRDRRIDDFRPEDFAAFRLKLGTRLGLVALRNEIMRVRGFFKWVLDNEYIPKKVSFGSSFEAPRKQSITMARNKREPKLFIAAEIHKLLAVASVQMRCMILLACNAGMGNSDLANAPLFAFDLEKKWCNYPRPKTGVARSFPLWPETAKAIQEVIAKRPTPKDDADAGLLFITKYGGRWCKNVVKASAKPIKAGQEQKLTQYNDDAIAKEFVKLFALAKMERKKGHAFYTLRHVHETIAGGSCDQVAVDYIMGHSDSSMASHYRESIDPARLQAVVAHVHKWLFSKPKLK